MGAEALSSDDVVKAASRLTCILADSGKLTKVWQKFKVSSMPTIVYTDPEGNEVARMKDRSPAGLTKQIHEIADTYNRAPKWAADQSAALEAGKSADQPAVLLFVDESPKSEMAEKLLGDPALSELYAKFSWSRSSLTVKSDEAKKIGLTTIPSLGVVDPRVDEPFAKPLKKITLPKAGKDLKGELAGVLKSWKPAEKKEGQFEKKEEEGGGMGGDE